MNQLKIYFSVFLLCILPSIFQAQNPFWTFPEEGYDSENSFINNLPISNNSTGYQGQSSQYVHAGIKDPYGEIIFFIVDGTLYDKNGNKIGDLNGPNFYWVKGDSQLIIVNVPGSCTQFLIFGTSAMPNGAFDDEMPFYALFDMDIQGDDSPYGGLYLDESGHSAFPIQGTILESYDDAGLGSLTQRVEGVHMAITKSRKDGNRWLFIANNYKAYRVNVTCDGLQDSGWSHIVGGSFTNGFRAEMELFEDSVTSSVKLAMPFYQADFNGNSKIRLLSVDSITGVTIPGSVATLNLGPQLPSATDAHIHGMEFSPDGSKLYITHNPSQSLSAPLSVYDYDNQTTTSLTGLSGVNNFMNSQIQVGKDGEDRVLWLASNNTLGKISDPNNTTPVWNPTAVPLSNYNVNYALHTGEIPNDKNKLHIVPSQVDIQDYDEMFLETCECCEKWSKYDAKDYIVTESQVWDGTNNSIYSGLTDFPEEWIFIRDSLVISAGVTLELKNMVFYFAPEAKVVIRRGSPGINGGKLIMDSTVFTVDPRCFNRKIICSDPLDSCDIKHWQGVRVEGYSDQGQSISGPTQQARLIIRNDSKIEHAKIAALAGSETAPNMGGGVINIHDSRIYDNETGIQYDPYVRLSGTTEMWNMGQIFNTHFATTPAFFKDDFDPKYFVHVDGIGGLLLYGNLYENQIPDSFPVYNQGTGIYTVNSRVQERWFCSGSQLPDCAGGTINRSEFKNLTFGIAGYNTISTRTLYVYHAIFNENKYGINIHNFTNPEILDNTFNVPRVDNSFGMWLNSSTGYMVENNSFQQGIGSGYFWTFGIVLQSSGDQSNLIYRNQFRDITNGIFSQGQNANPLNEDIGLRYMCNNFAESTIRNADIQVNSGNISDDQGDCSPVYPAGNFFSHSSTLFGNHYDFGVNPAGVDPNFQVVYRHHTPTTPFEQRLVPLRYTSPMTNEPYHVQLIDCLVTYDEKSACPVNKTSIPSPIDIVKSNETFSLDYITNAADSINADVAEAEDYLDGGNTWDILNMIENSEDVGEISVMVTAAGESLSKTVLKALTRSGVDAYQNLGVSTLESLNPSELSNIAPDALSSLISESSLSSGDVEIEWKQNRLLRDDLWRDVVTFLQTDTTGVIAPDEVQNLLNDYQPDVAQRFASARAVENGYPQPTWIDDIHNATFSMFAEVALPSASEDSSLPMDIPDHFEQASFDYYGNTAALNALYVENGNHYIPYIIPFEGMNEDLNDGAKSFENDDVLGSGSGLILTQPNPFNDFIQFTFTDSEQEYESMRIEMYDLLGRRLHSEVFGANQKMIRIEGNKLPTGLMTYVIFFDGVPVQNGKVIRMK